MGVAMNSAEIPNPYKYRKNLSSLEENLKTRSNISVKQVTRRHVT
jgi:hypothetical protein